MIARLHNPQLNNQLALLCNKISAKRIQSSMMTNWAISRKLLLKVKWPTLQLALARSYRIMRSAWNLQARCSRNRAKKSALVSALKFKNQLAVPNTLLTLIYQASNNRLAIHLHLSHLPLVKQLVVSNRRIRTILREITEMTLRMMTSKRRSNQTRTILIT